MLQYLLDCDSIFNVSVKHKADKVNALLAHDVWNPQIVIHDLVDAVERVLLVNYGIEEDAKCPYVLLLAPVRLARKDLRCRIVFKSISYLANNICFIFKGALTDSPN